MTQTVFVDANVLFSKTLMDWLFLLRGANDGMFRVYTTEDVLAEVLANMRKKNPQAPGRHTRHRADLIRASLDGIVADFPASIEFTGGDPHDYHVHAAATTCNADILLTCNDPADLTATPFLERYELQHPDVFFTVVCDSNPECLLPIVQEQLAYWESKRNMRQLDDALVRAGCVTFSMRVTEALKQVALLAPPQTRD